MSTIEAALAEIESTRYSIQVNLASDLRTFLRAVERHPSVQALLGAPLSPDDLAAISGRARNLIASEANDVYEHPADAAVATYLLILSRCSPEKACALADEFAVDDKWWWARKVVERMLAATP